jgi:tryptophan halogenase
LGAPFKDQTWSLFCDRAVTVQTPYDEPNAPIRPFTTSTAKENGWIWDIGLENRRGIGYVYSSRHTNETRAEEVLREYVGGGGLDLDVRHLAMRIGYRETQWVKNCLAIGLSAGFVEPLESTGLGLVEMSLGRFTELFTRRGDLQFSADQYNRQMSEVYQELVEFIKLHYYLSRRSDTDFWIENRLPETISQRLMHLLEVWKTRPTNRWDLLAKQAMFSPGDYHEVLFGMEHVPDLSGEEYGYPGIEMASEISSQNEDKLKQALRSLPKHRVLINQIYTSARNAM